MLIRSLVLVLASAALVSCSPVTDPSSAMNGTYDLQASTGNGPASGTLILTSKGYAERRVRYREPDGTMSDEYLSRGSAQLLPDSTIVLELREMNLLASEPWTPDAKLVAGGVDVSYPDPFDGSTIVESYRREE
jgi:hypothetical protein